MGLEVRVDDRDTDGWKDYDIAEEARAHSTPRAELHRLIDEMSDDAVERLLAVLHSWRQRYPSLLYVCTGLLLFSVC